MLFMVALLSPSSYLTYHAGKIPKYSNAPCPCKQGGRNLELILVGWSSGRVVTFSPFHLFTFFTLQKTQRCDR